MNLPIWEIVIPGAAYAAKNDSLGGFMLANKKAFKIVSQASEKNVLEKRWFEE